MFITGILAILQILFLPGLILIRFFKPKGNLFYRISVVVALSMLANATIIYPLIYLHLYTKLFLIILMVLEIASLLWLYRSLLGTQMDAVSNCIQSRIMQKINQVSDLFHTDISSSAVKFLRGILIAGFGFLAVTLILWFFRSLTSNIGTVFTNWDAVVSWNAWAQDWAQNQIPSIHLSYPQLLPLNLSITYVWMGNFDVTFFAKAIMPAFALLTVLMIFELAFEKKQYGYLIAVVLVYLMYKKFLGDYITDGYADIPVAFMTITALIPFLRRGDFVLEERQGLLNMIIAAAAALTKQIGLFPLVLVPVFAYLGCQSKTAALRKQIMIWFGISVLLVLPWYLPMGWEILHDFSQTGLSRYMQHSAQVLDSSSPVMRIISAFLGLGKYLYVYTFLLPAFFLVQKRFKLLIVFFILPISIMWGVIASYSARNLSITFALTAIIVSLGLYQISEYLFRTLDRVKFGRLGLIFSLLIPIMVIGFFAVKLDRETIVSQWTQKQRLIFSPQINEQMYLLDTSNPDCQTIMTNYPVDFLPGLKGKQLNTLFHDYEFYSKHIQDNNVCWILHPQNGIDENIKQDIDTKIETREYELVAEFDKWIPYRLVKIR